MRFHLPALALTSAILWGASILLMGMLNLIWPSYGVAFLEVMDSMYPGYDAGGGFGSVIVGTLYAVIDGAIGGLVFGWLYNLLAARCTRPATTPATPV